MLAPMLVQMERQIDREIAADQRKMEQSIVCSDGTETQTDTLDDSDSEMEDEQPMLMYGPLPQIITNDLKSLDEMVSRLNRGGINRRPLLICIRDTDRN